MQIKICGLKEAENIAEIDALWPDFIGMIFYRDSPRFVGRNFFPSTIATKVGVFVDSSIHYMIYQAKKHHFTHLQLHGNESVPVVKELYEKGFHIIKTILVSKKIDIALLKKYEPYCSYFLFEAIGKKPGGNGIKFNWRLLNDYSLKTPFLLSGGIGPEDVRAIKNIKHPAFSGIDLNSKFEIEPGIKNSKELKIFIDEIRK